MSQFLDRSTLGRAVAPIVEDLNDKLFGKQLLSPTIALIGTILVFLLVLITIIRIFFGKKLKKDTLLLLGLPNSGKTALFYQLKDGKLLQTFASMKENDATIRPVISKDGDKSRSLLHIVDVPGHERLRSRAFHFLPITAAIVYLVDSVEIEDNARSNAEYLYDLLTNATVVDRRIPIMVACNKLDLALYKKASIKKKIENEINKLRKTRSSQPDVEGEEVRKTVDLTDNEDEPFDFGKARTEVIFGECTVTENKVGDILNFAADHLKISI
jgi:signal recognition particle receptor subunit beta